MLITQTRVMAHVLIRGIGDHPKDGDFSRDEYSWRRQPFMDGNSLRDVDD